LDEIQIRGALVMANDSTMTFEEFKVECQKPVDVDKCRYALQRFINSEDVVSSSGSSIKNPDDDDILLLRALDELEELRKKLQWYDNNYPPQYREFAL
jgi:hypothetical protein